MIQIHLSPLLGKRGYDLTLPMESEWKQVIDYLQMFFAFSDHAQADHAQGQRILVHSNILTTGARETIYTEYILTRIQGGWSRHVAVFLATEDHPYAFHVNLYLEVEKRKGTWRGFTL